MTLGNIGKASYGDFVGKRKLLIVPYVVAVRDDPELVEMVRTYWKDALGQVRNLARSLGPVRHVFHEGAAGGEAGAAMQSLQAGNPHGYEHLKGLVDGGARLEQTEDVECLLEAMDLHRCMSVVQASNRVAQRLLEWFDQSRKARYAAMGANIDERIEENGVGVLVASPDHDIRFAANIEVVYVVPPVLDKINIWLREHPMPVEDQPPQAAPDDDTPGWAKR